MKLSVCFSLVVLLFFPFLVYGQDSEYDVKSEVLAFITSRDQEIKEAVRGMEEDPSLREKARSLINDQIDFQEMGMRSLGRFYSDLSTEDQQEFIDVFGQIVRSQSLSDLSVYEAPITIESVSVNGDQASVNTTVEINDANLNVIYHIHRKEDSWWLYDIIIDDVGTVEGYSVSFQTYVRKRGFEAFMESLRKRLAATQN